MRTDPDGRTSGAGAPGTGPPGPRFDRTPGVVVDIELTNRCGASCSFCPRDETPHQGLMAPEVLASALERVVELHEAPIAELDVREVAFCGLGDQLLNPRVADHVRAVREVGLPVAVNTNADLLDEERGEALLDAGVTRVFVNAGEVGDRHEAVYGLRFERVERNVRRFAAMAEGRCDLYVALVDHRGEAEDLHEVERFWRDRGVVRFVRLDLVNRGGALPVEGMDFAQAPQHAEAGERLAARDAVHGCLGPFAFPFIGYDGRYYLCSSDWRREASVGDVTSRSLLEVMADKLDLVRSRRLVCHGCNHDAVNRLTVRLAERDAGTVDDGEVDALVDDLAGQAAGIERLVAAVEELLDRTGAGSTTRRRSIPVAAAPQGAVRP